MKTSRLLVSSSRGLTLAAALVVASACDGGGGGSPTEPAPVFPQVAGSWSGEFVVPSEPDPATLHVQLFQVEANVTGTVTVEGFEIAVRGTLSARDGSGAGTLAWEVEPGSLDCGSWSGTLAVSQSDTRMQGPSRLSDVGCEDPTGALEGTITLMKSAGASVLGSSERSRSPLADRLAKLGAVRP